MQLYYVRLAIKQSNALSLVSGFNWVRSYGYIHLIPGSYHQVDLRPPWVVCEAHLHQAYKPCVIGAIPTNIYWEVLFHWHKAIKLGGDELHRAPVALNSPMSNLLWLLYNHTLIIDTVCISDLV